MEPSHVLSLLGGLSPTQFMRRHWQKKPLLVRQAIPGLKPVLSAAQLFALAARDEVESRLITRSPARRGHAHVGQAQWQLKRGPFARRALPPLGQPGWTLLVQGVDLHDEGAHELMQRFRFIPDARLDDVMISYASEGGGVGPHFDSYDVFLLQASGSRRWQISAQTDLSLQADVPLKILRHFAPQQEFVLHAGDMLYLPPGYAHDGVAVPCTGADGRPQACMTYSIGFRAPARHELAAALLSRLAEVVQDEHGDAPPQLYRDPSQPASRSPAAVPPALLRFAEQALARALRDPQALAAALGEYLSEPKPNVWFDGSGATELQGQGVRLHPRSRMLYDERRVFINGEALNARGLDARLMRQLADERRLSAAAVARLSASARELVGLWLEDGWLLADPAA
ncbi:MAG: cupin domain-containing protein [Betaproteobacteria bacterium]